MPRGIRSLLIIGAVTLFVGYPAPGNAQQIDSAIWSSLPYRENTGCPNAPTRPHLHRQT